MVEVRQLGMVVALLAISCSEAQPSISPSNGATNTIEETSEFCRGLESAGEAGNSSLRSGLLSTPKGMAYGGQVIARLAKDGGYQYAGAEKLNGTCWAYAAAKGRVADRQFSLRWRCPVKAYSVDRSGPNRTKLMLVDDRLCEFDKIFGMPAETEIDVEVFEM